MCFYRFDSMNIMDSNVPVHKSGKPGSKKSWTYLCNLTTMSSKAKTTESDIILNLLKERCKLKSFIYVLWAATLEIHLNNSSDNSLSKFHLISLIKFVLLWHLIKSSILYICPSTGLRNLFLVGKYWQKVHLPHRWQLSLICQLLFFLFTGGRWLLINKSFRFPHLIRQFGSNFPQLLLFNQGLFVKLQQHLHIRECAVRLHFDPLSWEELCDLI